MPDGQKPVLTGFEFHSIEFGNNQFLSPVPSNGQTTPRRVDSTDQLSELVFQDFYHRLAQGIQVAIRERPDSMDWFLGPL